MKDDMARYEQTLSNDGIFRRFEAGLNIEAEHRIIPKV
jgi:hypothetical protein